MNWVILVVAGVFEVVWAVALKYSDGFTRFWPCVIVVVAMALSVGLLGLAMKTLAVGSAYAVWVGVGTVGTVILGVLLLGEPVTILRITSIFLIICGIIGLKLA